MVRIEVPSERHWKLIRSSQFYDLHDEGQAEARYRRMIFHDYAYNDSLEDHSPDPTRFLKYPSHVQVVFDTGVYSKPAAYVENDRDSEALGYIKAM